MKKNNKCIGNTKGKHLFMDDVLKNTTFNWTLEGKRCVFCGIFDNESVKVTDFNLKFKKSNLA